MRTMLRMLRMLIVSLPPVLGLAPAAHAQKLETVRLATLAPGALLWLHDIAEVKGLYRANGLEVRRLQTLDSPQLVQAVASASAEAGVALGDVVMRAVDQAAPLIMVGGYLSKASLRMIGAKDVKSVKDLAGTRMSAGAVKGGTTNLMLYMVKLQGVDPNSIQRLSIPNSRDRVIALQSGQVRGAIMTAPFDIMLLQQGFPALEVFREPYMQTPLVVNTNWAAKNRATVVKLVNASRSAAQWINNPANRKEATEILAKSTDVSADVAEASYQFLVAEHKVFPSDFAVSEASLANIVKIDREINPSEHPKQAPRLDISKYYDASYLAGK